MSSLLSLSFLLAVSFLKATDGAPAVIAGQGLAILFMSHMTYGLSLTKDQFFKELVWQWFEKVTAPSQEVVHKTTTFDLFVFFFLYGLCILDRKC